MLREIGLSEMVKKGIPRDQCVFVARKRGNDDLAPSDELFQDFDKRKKALERRLGGGSIEAHNQAFIESEYEKRFRAWITSSPGPLKACHRRILLRIAEERFGAEVRIEGVEPK
jgi:hypothetical protein